MIRSVAEATDSSRGRELSTGNHSGNCCRRCLSCSGAVYRRSAGSRRGQLQPWLVPHSVQTPQAPARITFSLPQTEQMISMNMLPRASLTRSA